MKNLDIVKEAARRDSWYKRSGIFKEAYDILTSEPIKEEKPKAKPKATKKKGK